MVSEGFLAESLIIEIGVAVDPKENGRRVVLIDQPKLGMAREYYVPRGQEEDSEEEHPLISAYHAFMVETVVLLGGQREAAAEQMRNVIEFERRLARISKPREQMRDINAR